MWRLNYYCIFLLIFGQCQCHLFMVETAKYEASLMSDVTWGVSSSGECWEVFYCVMISKCHRLIILAIYLPQWLWYHLMHYISCIALSIIRRLCCSTAVYIWLAGLTGGNLQATWMKLPPDAITCHSFSPILLSKSVEMDETWDR